MRQIWTAKDSSFLVENYPNMSSQRVANELGRSVRSVYAQAQVLGLKKSDEFLKSPDSGRLQKGQKVGASFRFPKGHRPFNAGRKMEEWASAETVLKFKKNTFRKGHVPHNAKKENGVIVDHLDTRSGRLYKLIRLGLRKWIFLHRHVWIEANGEIPAGMVVIFKDGNTANCSIDNLELITKAQNMVRNSIMQYPTEVQELIRLTHKLKRKITQKNEEQN